MSTVEQRSAARARARDIGPPPPVVDPTRKDSCRLDLLAFLCKYLGHRFPLPFSRDHLDLIASVQGIILHGGLRALAMPRGSGKTTVLEAASLWALLYAHRRFMMVVAATQPKALEILKNIQDELQFCDLLHEDFPEATHAVRALGGVSRRTEAQTCGGQPTHLTWTREVVRLPSIAAGGGSAIQIAGITGAIRGAKMAMGDGVQLRPDLCLVDDFQTRASAVSASQVARRLQILQSDVLGLAGPGQRVACLCACTIVARNDGAAQILDKKLHPEWQGSTGRLLRSMPAPSAEKMWDKYTEIYREDLANEAITQDHKLDRATEYYAANRAAMDAGAEAGWPERVSPGEASAIQHAINLRITRGDEAFAAEYQNEPLGDQAAELVPLQAESVARRCNRLPAGVVPNGAAEVTAFVDMGEGVLWHGVGAFSEGFRCDLITYGAWPNPERRVFTKAEMRGFLARQYPAASMQESWWLALSALCGHLLDRDWMDESGRAHRIQLMLIDAGYGHSTDTVFDFCKRSQWADRIMPSRGVGIGAKKQPMADWRREKGDKMGPDWRMPWNKARKQREVVFGTNFWKSHVAARLLLPAGSPGSLSVYGDKPSVHELLALHLTAEKAKRVSTEQRTIDEWDLRPGRDNDLLDVVVGMHVAASIRGVSFDARAKTSQEKPRRVSLAEVQAAARARRVAH